MKILCLHNPENRLALELFDWLKLQGNQVVLCSDRLEEDWCRKNGFDLTLSYTYTHIIKQNILDALGGNVVNLHISFLPYNRGTYPNIWCILEGTPRGVTLHYIDSGIDTGDVICQRLVQADEDETLYTSYARLDQEAKQLFKDAFTYYNYWNGMRKKIKGTGTCHFDKDFEQLKENFERWDWNLKIKEFKDMVKC